MSRRLYLFGRILVIAAFALVAVTPGIADPATKAKKTHHKSIAAIVKWPQICPVSGSPIASIKDSVGSSVYKGKTYYFCCSMCKPIFDKDPAKYASAAAKGKYLSPM